MSQKDYNQSHTEVFKQILSSAYEKGNEMADISPMEFMFELSEKLKPMIQPKAVEGNKF